MNERRVPASVVPPGKTFDPRRARILARTLARDMLARGFELHDVLALAAELVGRAAAAREAARRDLALRRQRG